MNPLLINIIQQLHINQLIIINNRRINKAEKKGKRVFR